MPSLFFDLLSQLSIAHVSPIDLIHDPDCLCLWLIAHSQEASWICTEAPVQTTVDLDQLTVFLISDLPDFQSLKDLSSLTHSQSHVFMIIGSGIDLSELLSFIYECLTQPLQRDLSIVSEKIEGSVIWSVTILISPVYS